MMVLKGVVTDLLIVGCMKALIWGLWLVDRFHLVVRMVVFRFPTVYHSLGE